MFLHHINYFGWCFLYKIYSKDIEAQIKKYIFCIQHIIKKKSIEYYDKVFKNYCHLSLSK